MSRFNAYKVLELHRGSTDAEIKLKYRIKCAELHPDRDEGDPQRFMEVSAAYHDIKDAAKRNELAALMSFTMEACPACETRGYKKSYINGGFAIVPCGKCEGCGYLTRSKV